MLWDRREVVAASGAVFGAALAAGGAGANVLSIRPRIAVADSRFAQSAVFAREVARSGASLHWIDGDVTELWYHTLDLDWRTEKSAVAGLTGADALFCLERLAMDRGLRAIVKRRLADGRPALIHWLIAPKGARA